MIITESDSLKTVTEHDPEQPGPNEELLKSLYQYVILQIGEGRSNDEISNVLVSKGIDKNTADKIVSQTRVQLAQAGVDEANKNILYGALWCIGGTIITVGTMSMASGGGRYMVCYGAIIFGAIQFIRGLSQIGDAKADLEAAQYDSTVDITPQDHYIQP